MFLDKLHAFLQFSRLKVGEMSAHCSMMTTACANSSVKLKPSETFPPTTTKRTDIRSMFRPNHQLLPQNYLSSAPHHPEVGIWSPFPLEDVLSHLREATRGAMHRDGVSLRHIGLRTELSVSRDNRYLISLKSCMVATSTFVYAIEGSVRLS